MNWTTEQQKAIDERNHNILVAAAAGSGKTAVLVERIKKLIIKDGIPIDKMLIVTFTNAAASEMKEKIRTTINEMIDADPENSEVLREQLALLPVANISTFHSFALDVIRNFFYFCDIEPGFSICDNAQGTVIREEALDLLIESEFASDEEAFYDFLNWYSSDRNLYAIRDLISDSYDVLQSLPHPWQWLSEKINTLTMNTDEFKNSEIMDFMWKFMDETVDKAADISYGAMNILLDSGLERLAELLKGEWEAYEDIKSKCNSRDFDGMAQLINSFKSVTLRSRKDEAEDYKVVSAIVSAMRKRAGQKRSELQTLFFTQPLEEQVSEINQTHEKALIFEKLLKSFDKLFKAGKREQNLVDFNDIEHYCLDILDNEQAAVHYREKFEYIFIDEYQDTNVLQEEIISRVKREDNLFMVGDIKQSIYKFRLAEPSIFKGKYDDYSKEDGKPSIKIDLNKNYRSKSKILDEINYIFKGIMDDYDEQAMLYPGLDYDGEYNVTPRLKIVDVGTASTCDDEIANLKAAELEALQVGRIIEENIGKTYFDSKSGEFKQICPRDIVILMRSIKNQAEIFYNILKEKKINAFIDDNEGYFDTIEINVFMNLLSVIDNKYQDVPLISVLHSEIFDFSAEELAMIRNEHKLNSYVESFISYGENGTISQLQGKCESAIGQIEKWKKMAKAMPLPEFIWKLLIDTKYYIAMGAMPGGAQRQANLRALVDKAEKFSAVGQVSLYSFMKYIDAVKQRKVSMGQVKLLGENEDVVRIMSIHKSKGLEFPMVIVAGLGKKLNYTKGGDKVTIHKDIGLGMTLASFEEHWVKQTLIQRLIQKQVHDEEVQEEVRVLYVALTRAKDYLYMTGTIKDEEKFREKKETGASGDTTYLSLIDNITNMDMIHCSQLSFETDERPDFVQNPIGRDIYEGTLDEGTRDEIFHKLGYEYPHKTDTLIKSKYSVSELNRESHGSEEKTIKLAVPKFRQGEKKMTAAERGTIYHGFMERLDFVKARKEGETYIARQAEDYVSKGIFREDEVKTIDYGKLSNFFHTDIGERCAEAASKGNLRREMAFTLMEEMDGERVMVQGIIDCYFEEGESLVLLDYKTNWVDPNKSIEEEKQRIKETYKMQMNIYAKALEKATGKEVKDRILYLFSIGETVVIPAE